MADTGIVETQVGAEQTVGERRKGHMHLDAARRIRAMIQIGELPPGARLREVQLCEQLGVSRTPLREALRTLAAEGLVNQLPNRSMVVAALDPDDIEHLYRVFGAVEGLAGELACARVSEQEIAQIGRLFSQMVDMHEHGQRAEYMKINEQIHRMVIDIAANPVLLSVWLTLVPRVERARSLSNLDRTRWTAALFEHSKMFAALAARDGPLLRRLSGEHFLNGLPTLRSLHAAQAAAEASVEGITGAPVAIAAQRRRRSK